MGKHGSEPRPALGRRGDTARFALSFRHFPDATEEEAYDVIVPCGPDALSWLQGEAFSADASADTDRKESS